MQEFCTAYSGCCHVSPSQNVLRDNVGRANRSEFELKVWMNVCSCTELQQHSQSQHTVRCILLLPVTQHRKYHPLVFLYSMWNCSRTWIHHHKNHTIWKKASVWWKVQPLSVHNSVNVTDWLWIYIISQIWGNHSRVFAAVICLPPWLYVSRVII